MTARDILVHTRELLSVEAWWTKGVGARDADGNPVWYDSPEACSWCVLGALYRVGYQHGGELGLAEDALETVVGDPANRPVARWNDDPGTTHADVLAAFDRAIASLTP